jgi:hypothetical protein
MVMSGELHFQVGRLLVTCGVVLVILGLVFMAGPKFSLPALGKLPGDITFRNRHFQFYFPIASCVVVSVVLTLVLWIISLLTRK